MLGKDYMLAIILVNYDDNIWNDQNLEPDSDLPAGWRTIRDSTGTYYWHIPTGTTQWQHPAYSSDGDQAAVSGITITDHKRWSSRGRQIESPLTSISDRSSLPWQEEEYFGTNSDPDSKCFAVRSLGWVEIPEEDLTPGKSSLAVNNCIQQLSHSKCEDRDAMGAWGEGQDMVMILKKDTLSLVDPVDHSLIHCQPIIHIRVWGVGCNNGRRVSTAEEENRIKRQCLQREPASRFTKRSSSGSPHRKLLQMFLKSAKRNIDFLQWTIAFHYLYARKCKTLVKTLQILEA